MRFSEVLLRLGVSLVSWLVLYTHFLWLAVAGKVGCGPDGDEVFRVLLGLVPLTVGCALLLRASRPLGDVHRSLRWAGLPLIVLLPFGLIAVWQVGEIVYLGQQSICADGPAAIWERLWVPAQLLALIVAMAIMSQMWRYQPVSRAGDSES